MGEPNTWTGIVCEDCVVWRDRCGCAILEGAFLPWTRLGAQNVLKPFDLRLERGEEALACARDL